MKNFFCEPHVKNHKNQGGQLYNHKKISIMNADKKGRRHEEKKP